MAPARTDSEAAQSTPPSPETTMTSTQTDDHAANNSLDDIFGSSPPRSERELNVAHTASTASDSKSSEPSDLPSLRRQHVTAGYRDGTAASKGAHVQDGFDAGFPVGAQMGMRAGTVLGIIEGLLRGFEERSGPGTVKKPVRGNPATSGSRDAAGNTNELVEMRQQKREQLRTLYQTATRELDVQAVFADGNGPAEVVPSGTEEKAEMQLARRGDVILARWERRVDVPRWEEDMEALEMKEQESKEVGSVERS